MREFTGLEYLQIDIANQYGLERLTWDERLEWFRLNKNNLWDHLPLADKPILYSKAVHAWEEAIQGNPIGHIMYLDSTASGYQIMAVLSGCIETAKLTNIIYPDRRMDIYQEVVNRMNTYLEPLDQVTRAEAKKPIMTHAYNKASQNTLTEKQAEAFYAVIESTFPGPERIRMHINNCWKPRGLVHSWTMPDGHTAYVPVEELSVARIEVDELDHTTFNYEFRRNMPSTRYTSLAPNVIHSIDGYIARQVVLKCNFPVVTIHDAFGCHPNNCNKLRATYISIIKDIHNSDILNNICTAIGKKRKIKKDKDLTQYIENSEYMLS